MVPRLSAVLLLLWLAPGPPLNAVPGDILWSFDSRPAGSTESRIVTSPAMADDGTLYIGCSVTTGTGESALYTGRIYALFPDGSERWHFDTADWLESSPVVASSGIVFQGSWDGNLYALDPLTGEEIWRFATGGPIQGTPAIALDGTIYCPSDDGFLYAVDPDGNAVWDEAFLHGSTVFSSPAIAADGTVVFATEAGVVYALHPDGSERWAFTIPETVGTENRVRSSPAITEDGSIYVGSGDFVLYALNLAGSDENRLKWGYPTEGIIDSSPVLGIFDELFFANRPGLLYGLTSDGAEIWSDAQGNGMGADVGDVFYSSPAVDVTGRVYVASFPGSASPLTSAIYCIDPYPLLATVNYTIEWRADIDALIDSSPLIGPDGVLYVGAWDGRLYAIETEGFQPNPDWSRFRGNPSNDGRRLTGAAPSIVPLDSVTAAATGESVWLEASVSGVAPIYLQWRNGGRPVSGETTDGLLVPDASLSDAGRYELVASNPGGTTVVSTDLIVSSHPVLAGGDVVWSVGLPAAEIAPGYGIRFGESLDSLGESGFTTEELSGDEAHRIIEATVSGPGASGFFGVGKAE